MLKRTINYIDFNGDEVTEDHYFHLSKAELVEMELSHKGGMTEALQRIIASEDGKSIIAEFKNIILGSYGVRSADGKRFIKNQALRDEFESSEAYSTLFMELVMNAETGAEFINGVIPQDLALEVAKLAEANVEPTVPTVVEVPKIENTINVISVTRSDLHQMSREDFDETMRRVGAGEVRVVD